MTDNTGNSVDIVCQSEKYYAVQGGGDDAVVVVTFVLIHHAYSLLTLLSLVPFVRSPRSRRLPQTC